MTLVVCLFLVAITWLVFGQTLGHEFIKYDDPVYIQDRSEITDGLSFHGIEWALTHSHAHNWHPLTSVSHMLDCQFFGLKAGGHHFTNVLLHTFAVVLLFLVFQEMTGALWRSAFVAALFAIHPLHVESVAWVAERKDVLSAVFFMLTLGAYLYYVRKPSLARYVTMSILFACGLMSKPMLVTLPFVLLLLDYWPLKRECGAKKLILEKVPLLLLSAGSSLATLFAQSGAVVSIEALPFRLRVGNALFAYTNYLSQMFWPEKLAVFYPFNHRLPLWQVALALGLLLFISAAAFVFRKRCPYLLTGWLWYLGMLVPVIGLVQVGPQAQADRYTYLSHIGLYLCVTWAFADLTEKLPQRRKILGAAALIIITALTWRARIQTQFWRDTETLWRRTIAVTTQNSFAHAALAEILLSRNHVDEAIAHYYEALTIRPNNARAHTDLGLALFRVGDPSAGIVHWKIALEIQSDNLNAQSNLAWVFATCPDPLLRDGQRAVQLVQDVIKRSGTRNPILLRTLAAAYAESGQFSEAINTAQEALELATAQGNSGLASILRANIDHYKMNLPLRDLSLKNAHPIP